MKKSTIVAIGSVVSLIAGAVICDLVGECATSYVLMMLGGVGLIIFVSGFLFTDN